MLVYDVLYEAADAIARPAEDAGNLVHPLKRVIADCHLMLVVFAEFNRSEESRAVFFEIKFALFGGGFCRLGWSSVVLFSRWLKVGEHGVLGEVEGVSHFR